MDTNAYVPSRFSDKSIGGDVLGNLQSAAIRTDLQTVKHMHHTVLAK